MSSVSAVQAKSKNPIAAYFADFKVLKDNPKEFWGIQAINFLDSAAYFAMLSVAMLYLRKDVGFDLKSSGYVMTVFTSFVTISMLFSGVVGDVMGVRKSLWLSMGLKLVLSAALTALGLVHSIPGRRALVVVALIAMAPMLALIQTVFQASNVRFTSKRSRSAGFNLWYLFMNVGAFVAGEVIDRVRLTYKLPNAYIIAFGAMTSMLALVITLSAIRSEEQVRGPGEEAAADAKKESDEPKKKPLAILKDMVSESAFWRFLALVGVLLGVRAVFVYIYMLMPQYWTQVMGQDAPIGLLNQINPFLIVAGLILFIPIANRWSVFRMLTVGAIVSALSLFVLVLPWQMFSNDFGRAHFRMSATFMVVLSIGEVIWSPKLSEYTAAIAPKGQEGAYLGMSMMPWFIAKMAVSAMSGHMLERWSPDGVGERMRAGQVDFWHSPSAMWLVLGIWALAGPIVALMAEKWLTRGARWKADEEVVKSADSAAEAAA